MELNIETECVSVTIKGKMKSSKDADGANSSLEVKCAQLHSVEINDKKQNLDLSGGDGRHCLCVPPLFFEQTEYEFVIVSKCSKNISFYHEDPNIAGLVKKIKNTAILSGTVNFRNNIGYSDFVIRVDGRDYLTIKIEVYPSKISYRQDFEEIRDDVANEVYGLIFDYLNPTYFKFGISKEIQKNDFDFGIILDNLYKKIKMATDIIVAHPHHILQKEYDVVQANKVKRTDNRCIKWISKHPEYVQMRGKQIFAERMMNVKKIVSYNTKENRLTKHILLNIIRKIGVFKKLASGRGKNHPLYDRIVSIEKNIQFYLNTSFLANVEEEFDLNSMSLVFSAAPGYHELYRNNLLLTHGLDVAEQILNVHLKQISELYEYWCYIKLNALLRKKYQLQASGRIVTSQNNFIVDMIKGERSVIKYINPRNKEQFEMLYNNAYRNNPTARQKPDNVLCLHKLTEDGNEVVFKYVFDAKYRINYGYDVDELGEKIFENATPGPKDEDINVMHRYRDAIVYSEGRADEVRYKREMFGAYVLFPYDDEEEYKKHKYYESIAAVNIGGLPFLPNHTKLVERLLDDLVCESPLSAEDRGTLPRNIELKLQEIDWGCSNVLIGVVKRDQMQIQLENNFYHIPVKRVDKDKICKIQYVALYQSEKQFGFTEGKKIFKYGEICEIEQVRRSEITELPSTKDEYYYLIKVKGWEDRCTPILNDTEFNTVRYTNRKIFDYAKYGSELYLNEETWRLYYELRYRVPDFSEISLNTADFYYNGFRIFVENGNLSVLKNDVENGQERSIYSVALSKLKFGSNREMQAIIDRMKEYSSKGI